MAAYDLPGADFIPGLTAQDYSLGQGIVGEEAGLLDYTPPDVRWQAPLAPTGENIFANYVMTSRSRREPTADAPNVLFGEPDLLRTYNRRLARFGGPGGLPESPSLPGQPETMSEFGLRHWSEFGIDEGRKLIETEGPFGGAALWSDPGRSPYLGYPGGVRGMGDAGAIAAQVGRLPQPDVSGYEYAYPVWGWNDPTNVTPGYYSVGGPSLTDRYYTQDIGQYPYFPYAPGAGQQVDGSRYISVGQEMLPTSEYPEGRFRYHAGNWWEAPQ
jgi:hypothetical protein